MENKVQRAMPTLKKSQLLMYGFGGMFLNTFYLMFLAYYRLFFLTNVLMLDTYVAATINSISVWINVGTMVLAGIIVDSTNLKWGKFRSWVPIGGVMVTIAFPLMFANLGLSTGAAAVMFVVMFAIQSIGYNTLWVAERSLVGPMSRNTADATALATYAQQGSTIGGFIYGLVGTRILAFWGTGPNSYALTGLTFGLFILAGTFLIFFMTKKYDLCLLYTSTASTKSRLPTSIPRSITSKPSEISTSQTISLPISWISFSTTPMMIRPSDLLPARRILAQNSPMAAR